jgi:hypothetical protein
MLFDKQKASYAAGPITVLRPNAKGQLVKVGRVEVSEVGLKKYWFSVTIKMKDMLIFFREYRRFRILGLTMPFDRALMATPQPARGILVALGLILIVATMLATSYLLIEWAVMPAAADTHTAIIAPPTQADPAKVLVLCLNGGCSVCGELRLSPLTRDGAGPARTSPGGFLT